MRRTRSGPMNESTLLEHIGSLPHARATFKQLVRELGLKGEARENLDALLTVLTERGELIELRGGQFVLTSGSREFLNGRVSVHRDGYGFVVAEREVPLMKGDLFIPPDKLQDAMHGDRVIARVVRFDENGRAEGEVLRILRRAHATVVGEFRIRRSGCSVKPHDDRIQQWVDIPEGMEIPPSRESIHRVGVKPLKIEAVEDLDGLIVNVQILDYPEGGENPTGRVIEVLGHPDDFGIDVEIIIRKFHIPHQFPDAVIQQAKSYSLTLPEEEIARRRDFRDYEIVTIDGETARDFDDAVWVDRLPHGNYALHVHIADVGYYVQPGSPIDREALARGTSVYFPDRAVPMLPVELSTELCSLKPQVDRLVLSALLELDPKGDVVAQEFVRGVIRSAERMTYTNVHLILEGDKEQRERYSRLVPRFELMRELALILNRRRTKRGSIDFDMPEPVIEFDPEGQMKGVSRSPRNIAHRIIEEFMLAANEAVAGHLEELETPSVYRIHETPSANRIADFEQIANSFGYSLVPGGVAAKKFKSTVRHRDGRKTTKTVTNLNEDFVLPSRAYQKLVAEL
ncbi:MAG TPA: VacB/RNase II family 3'-5' exoribonuclease, partial [Bryobacteraceae bacterium]|nr:VacB/RNase II family 3'-5' exoribonuclease [Bryobacteraceae bacterium]